MKKIYSVIACILLFALLVTPLTAHADSTNYFTYEYDVYNQSKAAPPGYVCTGEINCKNLGLDTDFLQPYDMQYKNDVLYVLDSGNNRIVAINKDGTLNAVLNNFTDADGKPLDFSTAQGFAIDNHGNFIIADTANTRVLAFDSTHKLDFIISRPDKALEGYDNPFDAVKVCVDDSDQIYVIANSINIGAMVFSQDGEFLRFYGSNKVTATAEVILNQIKKRFMTQKQISAMKQYTPVSFTNFDTDDEGFIFTVTNNTVTTSDNDTVKKLNYLGKNILKNDTPYGDLEWNRNTGGAALDNNFTDIDVDSKGFMNMLDTGMGKVFQYSQENQLISVFGVLGLQEGTFSNPIAIESIDDKIYILDEGKACIYIFEPTDYANTFRSAIIHLNSGNLQDSMKDWNKLLVANTNSTYAYYGLGLVYDKMGDYSTAMEYFKLAGANSDYSNSFKQYRKEYMSEKPLVVVAVIAVIAVLLFFASRWYSKKAYVPEDSAFCALETKKYLPLYTLFHPIDGFSSFKSDKNMPSLIWSAIIVVSWFLASTFEFFYKGFSFNTNIAANYNLAIQLVKTIILFIVFVVANWSICTLFEGKGNLKEITCVTAYSLIPYVISIFVSTLLSLVLAESEAVFLSLIITVGLLWSGFLLICGLFTIHEFSISKLLLFLLITVLAMIIIVFIIMVFYSLLQQAVSFIGSLYFELSLRNGI